MSAYPKAVGFDAIDYSITGSNIEAVNRWIREHGLAEWQEKTSNPPMPVLPSPGRRTSTLYPGHTAICLGEGLFGTMPTWLFEAIFE